MARKEEKDVRSLLSDLGFMFEIFKVLIHAVLKLGGTREDLKRLVKEPALVDEIAKLIVGAKSVAVDTFHVMSDFVTPTYAELKTRFDWVNDWYEQVEFKVINACKSVSREHKPRGIVFEYVHMDRCVSTEEVLAKMEKRNLRPAIYEEGLAHAEAHPDEQRKFPIVMLGSFCADPGGRRLVAVLYEGGDGRRLGLGWVGYDWDVSYRFLAVSK